ncbi:MAG: type II toxin-antitoxin system HipA family toxin [Rhodocyclaceae bacterium]|nr:type II toxin-antitoxin system HipA family toxin [Rhodocyclaceae bacterium]
MTLPEKIRLLDVHIGGERRGELLQQSQLLFKYLRDDPAQQEVGLLMPPTRLLYQSNSFFPVMDQNLPEGYLFQRIREAFPKQPLTAMHLLALIGENGIGRLGFHLPEIERLQPIRPLSRTELLRTRFGPEVFESLVQAYLSTGIGIAGVQPKILVPDRATVPVPNLIVKAGSESYPGLAANEYLCLSAARRAGIETPGFDLSDDGQLLLVDRFDLDENGTRLGFEDIASLMGLCVRDTLSDRKYQGSYEMIAESLKMIGLSTRDLARFYEQVAFSVMVRNGDGHLKNFGVLYRGARDIRLSPLYDVVTTAIYRYTRYEGGPELEDRTLALRMFRKSHSKAYPLPDELLRFGRAVCGVAHADAALKRIAQAMGEVLETARTDERIPRQTFDAIRPVWENGIAYARDGQAPK